MKKVSTKRTARTHSPGASKVVPAAIVCIERFGAAKTTIEDVAVEAGVGRQTIYRAYPTRAALFEAVALQRLSDLQTRMKQCLSARATLEGAIVRGTLDLRSVARKDKIFMSVVEAAGDRGLERYLLHPAPAIREIMANLWAETFARARKRGELRVDLPDADIADWLRCVNYMMFLREDLTAQEQRKLLRQFVLPALAKAGSV